MVRANVGDASFLELRKNPGLRPEQKESFGGFSENLYIV